MWRLAESFLAVVVRVFRVWLIYILSPAQLLDAKLLLNKTLRNYLRETLLHVWIWWIVSWDYGRQSAILVEQ